jgi:hypothetical protein
MGAPPCFNIRLNRPFFEGVANVRKRSWHPNPESNSIDQLIERWWADHFPGSTVARDTQAWNVAHAAKERLKRLLKGSV